MISPIPIAIYLSLVLFATFIVLAAWEYFAGPVGMRKPSLHGRLGSALARFARRTSGLASKPKGTYYYPLFEYMADNYGLTLLESELAGICQAVDECRARAARPPRGKCRRGESWPCGSRLIPFGTKEAIWSKLIKRI